MYITLPLWWGVCGGTPSPLPYPPLYMCFGGVLGGDNPIDKIFQKKIMEHDPLIYKMRGNSK